ncbi:MAG TPA: exodeoxyribonuclease VII large subunit [Rhabdochlamydiaceae bacterium]|nr:exodeoxyribonuclease VII large subunit [Rhabdochlamydiaceae bacterium]
MKEILSVTELTAAIKNQLESRFGYVCVKGEISNLKEQASGHFYFTLKDNSSQISAVLFRGNARTLSRPPKSGDQVIAKGEITVYEPRGSYQILVREIEYAGLGELLVRLHELKLKLEKRGWFDQKRKKPLPKIPRTIGVVTSPTGSVIQDILHILTRRFSGFHLILNPVKVQGEGAAVEIAAAIEQFNRYKLADLLIVGRGGGSLEDLWAFNEEVVAAAIHASEIPIISAVGHETDYCIADYVADVRAPTPSAAAEIAMAEKNKEIQFLSYAHKRINQTAHLLIKQHRVRLNGFSRHPLFSSPYSILSKFVQLIDSLDGELLNAVKNQLSHKKMQLVAFQKQVHALRPHAQIAAMRQKLFQLTAHLKSIDPKNLLTKGYCILFSEKKNSVILSTQEIDVEQKLRILLHDGQIKATVKEVQL